MALAPALPAPVPGHARSARLLLTDGARTGVHVAAYDLVAVEPRVVVLRGQRRLGEWCAARGVADAVVGGFFTRPHGAPLGEVRTRGVLRRHVPFDGEWAAVRACVHVQGSTVNIARRDELPAAPRGDLLQAGPLLVRDGRAIYDRANDPEGFSAGAHQFDSDITAERHPRAAIGVTGQRLIVAVCEGRSRHDAGLTLEELAALMAGLGCDRALNLDGGGSTTLIAGGRLLNHPRRAHGEPEPGGRPVSTAICLTPKNPR